MDGESAIGESKNSVAHEELKVILPCGMERTYGKRTNDSLNDLREWTGHQVNTPFPRAARQTIRFFDQGREIKTQADMAKLKKGQNIHAIWPGNLGPSPRSTLDIHPVMKEALLQQENFAESLNNLRKNRRPLAREIITKPSIKSLDRENHLMAELLTDVGGLLIQWANPLMELAQTLVNDERYEKTSTVGKEKEIKHRNLLLNNLTCASYLESLCYNMCLLLENKQGTPLHAPSFTNHTAYQ